MIIKSVFVWEGEIGNRCSVNRDSVCWRRKDRVPGGSWYLESSVNSNRRNAENPNAQLKKVKKEKTLDVKERVYNYDEYTF